MGTRLSSAETKGQRADEQRQKRHGEKGVAGERVDAEKLIERLDEQRMHEVGAEAPAGERADARVSLSPSEGKFKCLRANTKTARHISSTPTES